VGHVHRAGAAGAGSYRAVASSEAGVLLEKNVEPGVLPQFLDLRPLPRDALL
jgi:hypothetical protein